MSPKVKLWARATTLAGAQTQALQVFSKTALEDLLRMSEEVSRL